MGVIFHYMTLPNLFNHSPTVEHLDCFLFVAIINDTVMNTSVHKPLGVSNYSPSISPAGRKEPCSSWGHVLTGFTAPYQSSPRTVGGPKGFTYFSH
jgi:hypothetical protein